MTERAREHGFKSGKADFFFDPVKFGKRIYVLRKKRCLSVEKVAKEIGVSKSALFQWEYGKRTPNAESLARLALFFDVSADFLIFGRGAPVWMEDLEAVFDGIFDE